MFAIVSALLRYLLSWLRPKHELASENLAFRHQIAVLNRRANKPRLQGQRPIVLGGPEEIVAKLASWVDHLRRTAPARFSSQSKPLD